MDLIEQTGPVTVDLEEMTEASGQKVKMMVLKGFCAHADVVNDNNRLYRRSVVEREVGRLKPLIERGAVVCELDHPGDGKPRYRNAASKLRKLEVQPDGRVYFESVVLGTDAGKDLKALADAKVLIGNSTRGKGTTTTETIDGKKVDVVNEDYVLSAFDHVVGQSVTSAEVTDIVYEQKRRQGEQTMTVDIKKLMEDPEARKAVIEAALASDEAKKAITEAAKAAVDEANKAESSDTSDGLTEEQVAEGEAIAEELVATCQKQEEMISAIAEGLQGLLEGLKANGVVIAESSDEGDDTDEDEGEVPAEVEERLANVENALTEQGQVVDAVTQGKAEDDIAEAIATKVAGHEYAEELIESLSQSCESPEDVEKNFPAAEQKIRSLIEKSKARDSGRGIVLTEQGADGSMSEYQRRARRLAGID